MGKGCVGGCRESYRALGLALWQGNPGQIGILGSRSVSGFESHPSTVQGRRKDAADVRAPVVSGRERGGPSVSQRKERGGGVRAGLPGHAPAGPRGEGLGRGERREGRGEFGPSGQKQVGKSFPFSFVLLFFFFLFLFQSLFKAVFKSI